MMRLLVDLNLVLDVLLDREPRADAAAAVWAAAEGAGCHAIATRNAGDFAAASLPVLSATEALAALRA